MGMDAGSRIGVPETEKDLHRGTEPPAFRSSQADHSPNAREWIRDCGYSQPVKLFRGCQAGQFVLAEVLFSRTEFRHLWSGAIGHHGNTETVVTLPRGHQSQGLNSVQPQESRILPDIQSTLQKTSQVVGNSFGLVLCHRAPGRLQEPSPWPIQTGWIRDRLRKACGTSIGNRLSGNIRQAHDSNYLGPWFQSCCCRRVGEDCWPTNDMWLRYSQRGDPMESRRGSLVLRGEDMCSRDQFSAWKSVKSIPWQLCVQSFWSSQDNWAGILGFLLASDGLACM